MDKIALFICCATLLVACGGGGSSADPAYTIGGSVSGLSGTVVLQNNGSNNLSISANGSFSFSSPAAPGAPYVVTVLTQPAGQACSVANQAGTVGSANVTSVIVTCVGSPSSSHTVGGSITGLTGTLVLQNNGQDNLTRSSNGSFLFVTSIPAGQNYAVTILTQPAGQTCTIANATGTMGASDVANVAITCSTDSSGGTLTWHGPVAISAFSTTFIPAQPVVATNSQGTAIVAWSQLNGATSTIKFARFSGSAWSGEQTLAVLSATILEPPSLAIDEDGNAVAAWSQSGAIYGSYCAAGGSWSTPQAISTPGAIMPARNGVGFTSTGTAIVISFVQGDGVYAIRRLKSAGWQSPLKLGTGLDQGDGLQIVFHANDAASALWGDRTGQPLLRQVTKRTYSNGTWGPAESSSVPQGLYFLAGDRAAADAAGNVLLLAQGSSQGTAYLQSLRYTGSGWAPSVADVMPYTFDSSDFHVSGNSGGNAVAVLQGVGLQVKYFTAASGWTAPATLTGSGLHPALGIDGVGNALVTWESAGGATGTVLASRRDFLTGTWSPGAAIDGGNGYNDHLDMAVSASGTAVTAWVRFINNGYAVYANYFR